MTVSFSKLAPSQQPLRCYPLPKHSSPGRALPEAAQAIPLRRVAQQPLRTLSAGLDLASAEQVLLSEGLGGAPVVEQGRPVGVLTRSDVLRQAAVGLTLEDMAAEYHRMARGGLGESEAHRDTIESKNPAVGTVSERLTRLKVGDAMSQPPVCIDISASAGEAARRMVEHGVHRLLVLDGTRLVGCVSAMDLVALMQA